MSKMSFKSGIFISKCTFYLYKAQQTSYENSLPEDTVTNCKKDIQLPKVKLDAMTKVRIYTVHYLLHIFCNL